MTFEFELEQVEYLNTISEIELSAQRKAQKTHKISEVERSALRGLLGALQWLATQTRMDLGAEIGLLQSCVTTATVGHLLKANKILRRAHKHAEGTTFRIQYIHEQAITLGWTDASLKNRRDESSTGGYVIGLTGEGILNGKICCVTRYRGGATN